MRARVTGRTGDGRGRALAQSSGLDGYLSSGQVTRSCSPDIPLFVGNLS